MHLTNRFVWLILLCLTHIGVAQNCTLEIEGYVKDSETKQPLSYASVVNKKSGKGSIASDKGCFILKNICPNDTIVLICQHPGCEPKEFSYFFQSDSTITLLMPHHEHSYEDIDLILDHHDDEHTQPKSTLDGTALDQQKGKTLGEALKKINGVTSLETGNTISKPVIHGMHSQRVKIYNNDVQLENQSWGTEHAPEIDPFLANKISIVKGAGSLRYSSSAMGGIILVEPKPLPIEPGMSANIYTGAFSNGRSGVLAADLQANHKKIPWFSWRIQGSAKRGGNAKTPDYFMKNTGFKESNFSWTAAANGEKLGIEAYFSLFSSQVGIFSASHIGNLTDLQAAFNSPVPLDSSGFSYSIDHPYQNIYHELWKLKSYWWISEESKLTMTVSRQFNRRAEFDKAHITDIDGEPQAKYSLTSHTADLVLENHIHEVVSSTLGINAQTQTNTAIGDGYFMPAYTSQSLGGYLIERFDREKTSFEAGIRADYRNLKSWLWTGTEFNTPLLEFFNLAYNIGGIYRFSSDLDLHMNLGTAWRPPLPNELYSDGIHHGAAALERGDSALTHEYAREASLQFNYHRKDEITAEVSFYHKLIDNYIFLDPTGETKLTVRGAFPVFAHKQADAIFQGIDLTLTYRILKNLKWVSKSSIVRAFEKESQEFLPFIPSDRTYNGLQYNFKKAKKLKNTFLEVGLQLVAKQSRIQPGADFVNPPNGYGLLNIESGCSVFIGKQRLDLGVQIKNLLNTTYREYMNRFRYFSDDLGRNISFSLKIPLQLKSQTHENE